MADYTGSFSGSFEGTFLGGVISSSAQLSIDWNSNVIANKPTTISPFQANSIVSNNRFRENTYPAISASVSSRLTIVEADIDTLSTQIEAAVSGNVPPGTISGSAQIAAFGYLTSASAAALGFGSGGGETYTAGLGITISNNVITLNTSSTHFIQGVSASAAASGFGSGGGGSNQAPTIADQSMSAVPESSSAGYEVGLITATDAEGNIITFASFTIANVYLNSNPSVNLTSSLGGTSLYDPSIDPFQANSSGIITRKNSVFLNADVADRYVYLATATDPFATTSGSGFVTIPISQDASSSIGADGGTYYIIESGITGDNLTTNSNGRTAGDITFTSAVSQMWVVNSTPSGYVRFVGGNTTATASTTPALELAQNISGSGLIFDLGSTIGIQITASEVGFETTKQYRNHTLNIAKNFAPSGSMVRTDANLNTNGARVGNTLATLTWTDTESNTLNHQTFTLTSNTGLTSSWNGGYVYTITPTGSVSAGTYYVSASVKDQHGFRIGSSSLSFTIAQAGAGTLNTTGGFYVLESATGSEKIVTNTNGRPTGTQVDLNVTYSPQYNSAAVASFTSSNSLIAVSSTGLLTVGTSISGSGYLNSGSISSSITWRDQYNNVTSSYIFVTVTKNYAPDITFTNAGSTILNTNVARSSGNPTLSTITFSDVENNPLNHNTFTLTDPSGQLSASRSGDSWLIKPITNLSASVYQMTASIRDIHGFNTATKTNTFEIIKASIGSFSQPSLYIVESALSGAGVTTESDGSGSAYTLSITYSPNYGTQTATNFSASGDGGYVFVHPTSGVVTIYNNLSGSAVQNGSSLTPLITWNDSYGNLGSQSLSVSVTDNQAATATFTDLTANWVGNPVASGVGLVSASISDPEVQIVSMSLSGTDAGSLVAVPQTFNSSSYVIKSATTLTPATYYYSASIHDNYGNTTSTNRSIVVTAPSINPLVYLYDIGFYTTNTDAGYRNMLGYSSATLAQPSVISTATVASGYGWAEQAKTYLGDTSFNFSFGSSYTSNLLASASVDSIRELVTEFGTISRNSSNGFVLCIPSGSGLSDIPRQMRNGYGGSADREYVLEVASDGAAIGSGLGTSQTSYIHQFSLNSALNGYTDYIFIGSPTQIASSTSVLVDVRPSSGSAT